MKAQHSRSSTRTALLLMGSLGTRQMPGRANQPLKIFDNLRGRNLFLVNQCLLMDPSNQLLNDSLAKLSKRKINRKQICARVQID